MPPKPTVASHMPQSLKRRFSKQVSNHSSTNVSCVSIAPSPVQACSNLPKTPIKSFSKNRNLSSIDGTPAKLISTPASATHAKAVRMPVRSLITPDEEDSIMSPTKSVPNKLTRRSGVRRLFDTPVKNKTPPVKIASSSSDDDDGLCDVLSGDLFASIKEKERKAKEENNPAISHAKWRKQMIAGLPKLFDSLLFIFQKRAVITKEELIHTIISCRLEIVDRREVEEQLKLLQEQLVNGFIRKWNQVVIFSSMLTRYQAQSRYVQDYQKLTKWMLVS